MIIGGLQKTSLTDYPGKVSAIVYTQGCNFRCGFCYNPELVRKEKREKRKEVLVDEFFEFLGSRKGKLDAVVVTGGEPTIAADLPEFLKKIKEMGFEVALYTNGTNSEMLKQLLADNLVDFVSMDVKTRLDRESYSRAAGVDCEKLLSEVKKSIEILKKSDIDYRLATTVVRDLVTLEDVRDLAGQIKGVKKFVIQPIVKTEKMLDNRYREGEPYSAEELETLREEIRGYFGECGIRN